MFSRTSQAEGAQLYSRFLAVVLAWSIVLPAAWGEQVISIGMNSAVHIPFEAVSGRSSPHC
jgi:hypothetical protein